MIVTANKIKTARVNLGESQQAFAQRFGVSQPTIHVWETVGPPKGGAAYKALEMVLTTLAPAEPQTEQAVISSGI